MVIHVKDVKGMNFWTQVHFRCFSQYYAHNESWIGEFDWVGCAKTENFSNQFEISQAIASTALNLRRR